MATKKKTGRPPSPFPERYAVRHSAAQLAAWTKAAAARAAKLKPPPKSQEILQSWIRETLDKAAGRG